MLIVTSLHDKRILLVSNSQGTAAGLGKHAIWSSYPHLLKERFSDAEFHFWNRSYLSVVELDDAFNEIVLNHRPDIVILQLGIIETGMRILPPRVRDVLRGIPFGHYITRFLSQHQREWRRFLSALNIRFVDVSLSVFKNKMASVLIKLKENDIEVLLLKIPELSEQCNQEFLFDNNKIIDKYNCVMDEIASEQGLTGIDPMGENEDVSRNSLFLKDSVHFTLAGHRLVADNVSRCLRKYCGDKI